MVIQLSKRRVQFSDSSGWVTIFESGHSTKSISMNIEGKHLSSFLRGFSFGLHG